MNIIYSHSHKIPHIQGYQESIELVRCMYPEIKKEDIVVAEIYRTYMVNLKRLTCPKGFHAYIFNYVCSTMEPTLHLIVRFDRFIQ